MATLTFSFDIGASSYSVTVNSTDARALEFIDDMRNIAFPEVDDGAGGTRVMTRVEAGEEYVNRLAAGQVQYAKGLKQQRLDAAVVVADDLEGTHHITDGVCGGARVSGEC